MAIPRSAIWGPSKSDHFLQQLISCFNVFIFASAVILIVSGALIITDLGCTNMSPVNIIPPSFAVSAGTLLIIAMLCGCVGTVKESVKILLAYCIILFIVFILEIFITVILIVYKDFIQNNIRSELKKLLRNYKLNSNEKYCIDRIQKRMKCCGVDYPKDWIGNEENDTVPESCCYSIHGNTGGNDLCNVYQNDNKFLYNNGCFHELAKLVDLDGNVVFYCAIVLSAFKVFSIILTSTFVIRIWKANRV